jgi:hypothetical protein
LSFRAFLSCTVVLFVAVACSSVDDQLERNNGLLGFDKKAEATGDAGNYFRRIAEAPSNAKLHFENGIFLANRGRSGDLELASVAFLNAIRLAPDWWEPNYALASIYYRLGNYDESLLNMADAVDKRGSCEGICSGLALVAFRARLFNLAAYAHRRSNAATAELSVGEAEAASFLTSAFSNGAASYPTHKLKRQTGTAKVVEGMDKNVSIDAYIIKQTRRASSSHGINLVKSLQLQFGSTLVNLNETTVTGSETQTTNDRSVEVSIPSITYSLNIAAEDSSTYSIEASPSIVSTAGQTSHFFDGSNVEIIPPGDNKTNVTKDIGVDLKATPQEITESYVDLSAVMELSNLTASTVAGGDGQVLQTEKTTAEAFARIPFGRAMALGSGASLTSSTGSSGVPDVRKAPLFGNLFGSDSAEVNRKDVLVLISVRNNKDAAVRPVDENEISTRLFGSVSPHVDYVSRLPYEAPMPDFLAMYDK